MVNQIKTEQFRERLYLVSNGKFILTSKYINMKSPITYRCKDCGETYERMADNALRRTNCMNCNEQRGKYKKQTYADLIEKFAFRNALDDYDIGGIGDRGAEADSKKRIEIIHKVCQSKKTITPYELPEYTCNECERKKWREENYKKLKRMFLEETDGEYELLSDSYINNQEKLRILHTSCGREFLMSKNHFFSAGHRCPRCSTSKGEQIVSEFLSRKGIAFLHNYRNSECINPKSGKRLEMDFQLLSDEGKVFALIEYDGKQHFYSDELFGSSNPQKVWQEIVLRDNVRTRFAKEKGFPLLRIPYTYDKKMQIEKTIDFFLKLNRAPARVTEFYSKFDFNEYGK